MADGKTHEYDSTAVAIPLGLVVIYATNDISTGLATGFGCLCGIFLTPDLDVDTFTRSKRKAVNASPLGWLWVWFWYPYAKVIKHRAWVSHLPLASTLLRVGYLSVIPLVIAIFLEYQGLPLFESIWLLRPLWVDPVLGWLLGLAVSDLVHWVRDGMPIVGQSPEIRA